MRALATFLALCVMMAGTTALADPVGRYRANEGPELAAELLLNKDGTYAYALAVGALDETSRGTWREEGDAIRFSTEPKPMAPEFRLRRDAAPPSDAFLLVSWPNGRSLAGIDFRIGFDQGDPIEDYTQSDGWAWPADEKRVPRWIELAEPIYRLASPRFPIAPGTRTIRFELVPNDIGVVDFTGATARVDGDRLILRRTDGVLNFVKTKR